MGNDNNKQGNLRPEIKRDELVSEKRSGNSGSGTPFNEGAGRIQETSSTSNPPKER